MSCLSTRMILLNRTPVKSCQTGWNGSRQICALRLSDRDAAGRAVLPGAVKRTVLRKRSAPKALCASFFGDSADDEEMRGVSACMTMFRRSVIETGKIRFRSEREYFSEDTIFNLDFCLLAKKGGDRLGMLLSLLPK